MNGKIWIVLAVVLVLTAVMDFWYEPKGLPVYYALFGVVGCLLMLFLTKGVAKKVLSRKEDYYERT
jgi:hypothetical protein